MFSILHFRLSSGNASNYVFIPTERQRSCVVRSAAAAAFPFSSLFFTRFFCATYARTYKTSRAERKREAKEEDLGSSTLHVISFWLMLRVVSSKKRSFSRQEEASRKYILRLTFRLVKRSFLFRYNQPNFHPILVGRAEADSAASEKKNHPPPPPPPLFASEEANYVLKRKTRRQMKNVIPIWQNSTGRFCSKFVLASRHRRKNLHDILVITKGSHHFLSPVCGGGVSGFWFSDLVLGKLPLLLFYNYIVVVVVVVVYH